MKLAFIAVGVSALLMTGSFAQAAGLLGDNVQVIEYYPDLGNQYGPISGPNVIPSGGFTFTTVGYSPFTVDVAPTQITVNGPPGSYPGTFDGFDIQDLSLGTTITSASLSTSGGLPSGNLTYNAHNVYVNLANTYFTGTTVVDFSVSSGVAEPATWAMMLVGFGSLGVAMRSRRKIAMAAKA